MPTYQYACTACSHQLEATQSFTDDPLTVCPECAGALRKVFSAVGVVFKGSGFYRNDSRAGNGKNGSSERSEKSKEGSGNGSSGESATKSSSSESSGSSGGSDSKGNGAKSSGGSTAAASSTNGSKS